MTAEFFLIHLNGPLKGERIEITKQQPTTILIGRENSCHITTETKYTDVSARHCEVSWTTGGLFITDLGSRGKGSTNGTYINGSDTRIVANQPYRLVEGDEIRLGYDKLIGVGPQLNVEPTKTMSIRPTRSDRPSNRIEVFEGSRSVLYNGYEISFSRQQFMVIAMLWKAGGAVCTSEQIFETLWPDDESIAEGYLRTRLHTLVQEIRKKIIQVTSDQLILTVHRVGYRLQINSPD